MPPRAPDYRQVVRALRALGFEMRPQKATGHEQWFRGPTKQDPQPRKVTVSKHLEPFGPDLVASMARQAGVEKRRFLELMEK